MNLQGKRTRRCLHLVRLGRSRGIFRIDEEADHGAGGHQLAQQLEPLRPERIDQEGRARDVAARPVEACDKAEPHRIGPDREHDRNACRRRLGGEWRSGALDPNDRGHWFADQIDRQRRQPVELPLCEAVLHREVAALDVARFIEALPNRGEQARVTARAAEQADHRHRRLRTGHERRRGRRSDEECEELAPLHSITSTPRPLLRASLSAGHITIPRSA